MLEPCHMNQHADTGTPLEITTYVGLRDTDSPTLLVTTWPELVKRFSVHRRVTSKDEAGGFGPYKIQDPFAPCYRHKDGLPRAKAHRCDECVQSVTLACFDADMGGGAEIEACRAKLREAGLAQLWYSSFSYNQAVKQGARVLPFRLVLPLSKPMDPGHWFQFRKSLIQRFGIPADPRKCGGRSHFYYEPSCPHWGEPAVYVEEGKALEVDVRAARHSDRFEQGLKKLVGARLENFEPPAEVEGPEREVRMAEWREALQRRHTNLVKKIGESKRATWLGNCLAGLPLAGHGNRNDATCSVAGMLVFATDGKASLGELVEIMRPSIEAMRDEGSTVQWEDVERLLLTSMRNRFQAEQRDEELIALLRRSANRIKARIPVVTADQVAGAY